MFIKKLENVIECQLNNFSLSLEDSKEGFDLFSLGFENIENLFNEVAQEFNFFSIDIIMKLFSNTALKLISENHELVNKVLSCTNWDEAKVVFMEFQKKFDIRRTTDS